MDEKLKEVKKERDELILKLQAKEKKNEVAVAIVFQALLELTFKFRSLNKKCHHHHHHEKY